MSKITDPEWLPFRCQLPKSEKHGWGKADCSALECVYHVAHVPEACRILEDGRIKAGLIGDESRLRKTRTSVSWLSANTWARGSIYGNVQFEFAWNDVVQGRRIYWVEAMAHYSTPAYRFLITDRDLDGWPFVTPYNPQTDKGPLRRREDEWYCNTNGTTAEFMLDRNIHLSRCRSVTFIKHHPSRCKLHGSSCPDNDRPFSLTGAQVLAFVIGKGLTRLRPCFLRHQNEDGTTKLGLTVRDGVEKLFYELEGDGGGPNGPVKSASHSKAVLRGALLLYGAGRFEDARDLVGLLGSSAILRKNLETLVVSYLKLTEFSLPD